MSDSHQTIINTRRNRTIGKESLHELPKKFLTETNENIDDINLASTLAIPGKKSVSFGSSDIKNFKSHLPPSSISGQTSHTVLLKKSINSPNELSEIKTNNSGRNNFKASHRFDIINSSKPEVPASGKGLYDILKDRNSTNKKKATPSKATKNFNNHTNKCKALSESTNNIDDEPIIKSTSGASSSTSATYAALAASMAVSKKESTIKDSQLNIAKSHTINKKVNNTNKIPNSLLSKKASLSSLSKTTHRKKRSANGVNTKNKEAKNNEEGSSVIKIPDNRKYIINQIIKESKSINTEAKKNTKVINVKEISSFGEDKSSIKMQNEINEEILNKNVEHKHENGTQLTAIQHECVRDKESAPRAKVDYAKLNNDLNDMVNAYIMGIYDDDVGIEYDMPNSIIETTEDIAKYNQQVLLLEKEIAEENQRAKEKEQNNNKPDEKENKISEQKEKEEDFEVKEIQEKEDRPILSDEIIERLDSELTDKMLSKNNHEYYDDEAEEDLGLSAKVLNLEISQNYQSLRQLLMGSNFTKLSNQEKEFEELNENGEPIKVSRFRAAQLSLNDQSLFQNLN